jgi:hypothetical protein
MLRCEACAAGNLAAPALLRNLEGNIVDLVTRSAFFAIDLGSQAARLEATSQYYDS